MARKSKSSTPKKKSAGSSRRKPALAQGVGVLSSIPFAGDLRQAFEAGLGSSALIVNVQDDLGYDTQDLEDGLRALNWDPDVGLIVTAGGLVTLKQAIKEVGGATKYFISLVGGRIGVPPVNSRYFLGGLSLESYGRNPLRFDKLKNRFSIGSDDAFCLLSNPNSDMAPIETNGWINGNVVDANVYAGTADPYATYKAAFGKIGPNVRAVIVSADPYFNKTAADLVRAANEWIDASSGPTRVVCYPLQEFARHGPRQGKVILHGPDLRKAYRELGKKARAILRSTAMPPVGSFDDVAEVVV